MLSRLLRANPKKRASIENIRLHPWTNDGYSKPPMQQPLSNINHKDRRRLSSKISCLVDTPIKGMTPTARTRSDSRISEKVPGIKPRTPSSGIRPVSKPGESNIGNPNVKRRLVMEPSSPSPSMNAVSEEPELERPKSASAMLSKPSKPPRPSRSKIERCEMIDIPGSPTQEPGSVSGGESVDSKNAVSPEAVFKRSSSYGNEVDPKNVDLKFKLTPDRRTLSENTSLAKFSCDEPRDFKPPLIKDAGEITMVDSESHLFDGFGGSARNVHYDHNINDFDKQLREPSLILSPTEEKPAPPLNNVNTITPPKATPTTQKKSLKKPVEARTSLPRTTQKDINKIQKDSAHAARSKAAINKTGLGAKRPLGRSTEKTTQSQRAAKSAGPTRDRPSSVKQRVPAKATNNTVPAPTTRSRRNSDVMTGSMSNLSLKSEADMSSDSSATKHRSSSRNLVAPSPAKPRTNTNIKSKVDCHRSTTGKRPSTTSSGSGEIIKNSNDKEKEGVKSKINSLISKPSKTHSRKTSDVSVPGTPRTQRNTKVAVSCPTIIV